MSCVKWGIAFRFKFNIESVIERHGAVREFAKEFFGEEASVDDDPLFYDHKKFDGFTINTPGDCLFVDYILLDAECEGDLNFDITFDQMKEIVSEKFTKRCKTDTDLVEGLTLKVLYYDNGGLSEVE